RLARAGREVNIVARGPSAWGPREHWTIPDQLRRRVERTPDRPAIAFGAGEPLTYAQVDHRAEVLARRLETLGVVAGERVLILMTNRQEFIDAWLALNRLGAIDVSMNTAYRHGPLVHAVNLSGASVLLTTAEFLPRVAEVAGELPGLRTVVLLDGE